MPLKKVVLAAALAMSGSAAFLLFSLRDDPGTVYEPVVQKVEPGSPCPWREASLDMTNWFPEATQYYAHDLILSGKRPMLQEQLGRSVRPEEMALHTYLVGRNEVHLGTVLTRRIKADHGAIEIVLALDPDRRVRGLKIQRIREPEEVVRALSKYELGSRFVNFGVTNAFTIERDHFTNAQNEDARRIAQMIADEARALLVLYEAGHQEFRIPHHH